MVLSIISKLPEVTTVTELAKALRVSNQTIIRAIIKKKLRATKVGRDYRIEKIAIMEWLELEK